MRRIVVHNHVYARDQGFKEEEHPRGEGGKFSKGSVTESRESRPALLPAREQARRWLTEHEASYAVKARVRTPAGAKTLSVSPVASHVVGGLFVGRSGAPLVKEGKTLRPMTEAEAGAAEDVIAARLEEVRAWAGEEHRKFEPRAGALAKRISELGYDVHVSHPADTSSRYLFVALPGGEQLKVRYSDHPQPVEGGKVVGGFSTKTGRRYPPADISIDPETKLSEAHVMSRLGANNS